MYFLIVYLFSFFRLFNEVYSVTYINMGDKHSDDLGLAGVQL